MKLYAGLAPNAFRVFVFMQEKDIELPLETLDVMKGDARQGEHIQRNSLGEIPVLELDDGSYLTESIAICRYLEFIYPEIPLMGRDSLGIAKVEMWNRRMEQQIMAPYAQIGLHTMSMFADKIEQVPEYAQTQRRKAVQNWAWLDTELADGRAFVSGDDFTVADITGMTALMIGEFVDVEVPTDLNHVQRWVSSVTSRESWDR